MMKRILIVIGLIVLVIVGYFIWKYVKRPKTSTVARKLQPGETIEEGATSVFGHLYKGGVEEGEFTRNGQEPARTMDMTNLRLWQR